MAFEEARHRQRHNSQGRGGTPFSPELRNFLQEGRKNQTLYKYCEGYYDRRKLTGRNMLQDFIVNSIYMSESSFSTGRNSYDSKKVDLLTEKIISRNNIYRREEIHIFVVWVYYFDYDRVSIQTTPVFKIFKTDDDNNVEFVDVSGKFYGSWDYYLENAKFPESFLCVPRDGKYTFVGDTLDLDFVCGNFCENANTFSTETRTAAPFFERFVLPCIQKIKTFFGKQLENFKKVLQMLVGYWHQREDKFGAICFTVGVVVMGGTFVMMDGSIIEFVSSVNTIQVMLFNTCKNLDLLGPGMDKEPLSTVHSSPALSEVSCLGTREEIKKFIELLGNFKKNWREILKLLCILFRKCSKVLLQILTALPSCPVLSVLSKWLLVLDVCAPVIINNIPENKDDAIGSTNYDVPWSNSCEIANNGSVSHSRIDLPRLERETKDKSNETVSRSELPASDKAWEVALNQLGSPGEVSSMTMMNYLEELRSLTDTSNNLAIGTIEDKVLFVFPNGRMPILKCLTRIFPRARSINIISSDQFDLVDSEGETFATLFFPADHIAICISSMNGISQAHEETSLLV